MIAIELQSWLLAAVPETVTTLKRNVFVEQADQGVREYIVVSDIDSDFQQSIDGDDKGYEGLIESEADIDVVCETAGRAKQVAKSILSRIKNHVGGMGDRRCEAVFIEGFRSAFIPSNDGRSRGRHVFEISLRIQHQPSGA